MKPWAVISLQRDAGVKEYTHVVPLDDMREHEVSCLCWCHPHTDSDDPDVVIHHSLDGREASEFMSDSVH